jgi:hypothetical protein
MPTNQQAQIFRAPCAEKPNGTIYVASQKLDTGDSTE